jgi:phosphoribosylformylglycinamidine synthase
MAGRSGSGMRMDLSKVPAREEGMTPYEFMLSESQERMLICAKKGCEAQVLEIFRKWDLDAEVIGEVTDTGVMELYFGGEKVAEIPVGPVSENAPILDRPVREPAYLATIKNIPTFTAPKPDEALRALISHPENADKAWIYEQYDSMVQTNTIKAPGSLDASVIRVRESGKGIAMSSDCNPRMNYIDPKLGAAAAVMESGRNVAMSGARPLAITDCLNYGNPENPEVMWQFMKGCEGIKEACLALSTPVVSGNVSLYNETEGVGVFPTPSIAMVGLLDDADKVLGSSWQKSSSAIYLLGETRDELGGSLYLKLFAKAVAGEIPTVDYDAELGLWELVIEANKLGLLRAAKDINSGGLATACAKMCAKSGKGANITSGLDEKLLFSESFSRAVVEVADEAQFAALAAQIGVKAIKIGTVEGSSLKIDGIIDIGVEELQNLYFDSFKKLIQSDL